MSQSVEQLRAGYQAKIKRAREHCEKLEAEVLDWQKPDRYDLIGEFDRETSWYVWTAKVHDQPPIEWALTAAEIAYHLRSALDHLVSALRVRFGGSVGRGSGFPALKDSGEWKDRGLPRLRHIPPRWISIIERLQPYHAGNEIARHPLTVLNGLANMDKHQSTYPLLAVLGYSGGFEHQGTLGSGQVSIDQVKVNSGPLEDGAQVIGLHFSTYEGDPQIDLQDPLAVDVVFAEGPIRVQDLRFLVEAVERIVSLFEPAFQTG